MGFIDFKTIELNGDQQDELVLILEIRLCALFDKNIKHPDLYRMEHARKTLDIVQKFRRKSGEMCCAEWVYCHYTDVLNEFTSRFCVHGINTSNQPCEKCADPKLDGILIVKPGEKVKFPFGMQQREGKVVEVLNYFAKIEFYVPSCMMSVNEGKVWVIKSQLIKVP